MDGSREISQQLTKRSGYPGNEMGLYNYEKYVAVVDWNMPGWSAPEYISGNIEVVKINDIVTLTIRPFLNTHSGVVGNRPITSFVYRLPKRFWPKMETLDINNIDMQLPIVCYQDGVTYSMGYVSIRNQVSNPLLATNGMMSIYALNTGSPGFNNLSGNIRTTTVSYQTNSIFNE